MPNSVLKYEFQTESYDIGFSVVRDGVFIQQMKRVNSHLKSEEGQHVCEELGAYTVAFANSYSIFRRKRLYYRVELSAGVEKR